MSRKFFIAIVAATLAVGATSALGVWQMRRAAGKEALQALNDAATRATPRPPDRTSMQNPASLVSRHLALRGTWVRDHVVYLDNRPRDGQPGFYVLMALRIESPLVTEVIVNRGWLPRAQNDRARIAPYATPSGVVDITGVALADEPRLMELGGANERSLNTVWQNFDFGAYVRASGQKPIGIVLRQDRGANASTAAGSNDGAANDGAANDGAANDGAANNGAMNDSPANDGPAVHVAANGGAADDGLARDWPDRGGALQGQIDRHHGYAFQWFALATAIAAFLFYRMVRLFSK